MSSVTEPELLEKKEDSNWRCQNQKIFFKYNDHVEKTDLLNFFKGVNKNKDLKFIRCAHETGETGYKHTHVLVDFGKIFQSKNVRIFDFNNNHPNIKFVVTKTHWNNAINYIAKEDPENADLKTENNWMNCLAKEKTLVDAMKYAQKPTDVMGIKEAWKILHKVEITRKEIILRDWQIKLIEIFESEPDRKVHWIWDEEGGMGKSTFSKYMMRHFPEKVLVMKQLGGEKDSATIIVNHIESHPETNTIILDLPRDAENRKIYGSLESIKDGIVTSIKYEGKTVEFNECHVFVFANFLPDVTKMSKDRWVIFNHNFEKIDYNWVKKYNQENL